MQYITLYSSYSWPGFPGGGTKLFLIGADYAGYKKAKWTQRYLLVYRRILKKGQLYPPSVNPFFQKETGGLKCNISKPPFRTARPITTVLFYTSAGTIKRKEPIIRAPVG